MLGWHSRNDSRTERTASDTLPSHLILTKSFQLTLTIESDRIDEDKMTMDIQKYQGYEESSPDTKGTNLCIESARTRHSPKSDMYGVTQVSKPSKRSFDVAFLMMPDEKFRQKQTEKQLRVSKQLFANQEWQPQSIKKTPESVQSEYSSSESPVEVKDADNSEKCYDDRLRANNNLSPGFGSEINIDVGTDEYPSGKTVYGSDSEVSDHSRSRPNSNESAARPPKFLPESPFKNKVFDDPTIISMQSRARFEQLNRYHFDKLQDIAPKSAFTKVSNASNYTLTSSPNPSMSPDNLLYQNSISPPLSASSPPRASFNKNPTFNSLLSPNHPLFNGNPFFKSHNIQNHSHNYMESAHANQNRSIGSFHKSMEYQHEKPIESGKHGMSTGSKFNNLLPFRPDLPAYLQAGSTYPFAVQNFHSPSAEFMKFSVPPREPMNPLIANPAAAILSTLLPPSLTAFSLQAQNVCAKCNISFRMTSDLVYHMRTHHRSEVSTDPNRRKREEKLKCPVCAESFRERHHLTRHMTAHQDKEGDLDDMPHGSHGYSKSKKQFYNGGSSHK